MRRWPGKTSVHSIIVILPATTMAISMICSWLFVQQVYHLFRMFLSTLPGHRVDLANNNNRHSPLTKRRFRIVVVTVKCPAPGSRFLKHQLQDELLPFHIQIPALLRDDSRSIGNVQEQPPASDPCGLTKSPGLKCKLHIYRMCFLDVSSNCMPPLLLQFINARGIYDCFCLEFEHCGTLQTRMFFESAIGISVAGSASTHLQLLPLLRARNCVYSHSSDRFHPNIFVTVARCCISVEQYP